MNDIDYLSESLFNADKCSYGRAILHANKVKEYCHITELRNTKIMIYYGVFLCRIKGPKIVPCHNSSMNNRFSTCNYSAKC